MAFEKLILRSILYGADKIPDSWFDKIPGGYFKAKKVVQAKSDSRPRNDRRHSTYDGRKMRDEDRYYDNDDKHRSRSDRHRGRRSRSSHDGGDDEDYHSGDDWRESRRAKAHRRRHTADDDRYGANDGHRGRLRDVQRDGHREEQRRSARVPYQIETSRDSGRPFPGNNDGTLNTSSPLPYVSAGAAKGATRNNSTPYPQNSAASSPRVTSPPFARPQQTRSGSSSNGYVPYAHIYGQTSPDGPQHGFTPPLSDVSVRPNDMNMVSPPISKQSSYRQSPFAREASTAAGPGIAQQYTEEPGTISQDPRFGKGYEFDPDYSARRYTVAGYNEDAAPHPPPSSPDRRSPRADSFPSYASFDTRLNESRSRSDRRSDDSRSKLHDQGEYQSRMRVELGATGAAIAWREVGEGTTPTAIGAALATHDTNAFEARERYVDPRNDPNTARAPSQPSTGSNGRKGGSRDAEVSQRDERMSRREEGFNPD